jgi:hypothetical protein
VLAHLAAADAAMWHRSLHIAALATMPALVRFVAGKADFASCGGIPFI